MSRVSIFVRATVEMAANMNTTGCIDTEDFYLVFLPIVFGILSILVIGGNTFCLIVLKQARYLKTSTRLFLTSLTCADLLTGLLVSFPSFVHTFLISTIYQETTSIICGITRIISVTCGMASLMSLFFINIDRYLAVEFPLHSETIVTVKRARIAVVCLWVQVAIVTATCCFILMNNLGDGCKDNLCQRFFMFDLLGPIVMTLNMFIFAVLPYLVTITIYVRILLIVCRHKALEKKLFVTGATSTSGTHRRCGTDRKALNIFLLVTVVSSLTWLPFTFFSYYAYFVGQTWNDVLITILVMTFYMNNSWVNILIYTVRDRSFRNDARKLLRGWCKRCFKVQ